MNLYLIYQDKNTSFDSYDSAVVAAETEEDARLIHPRMNEEGVFPWSSRDDWPLTESHGDWTTPNHVGVCLIGVAKEGTQRGVICASFNAG